MTHAPDDGPRPMGWYAYLPLGTDPGAPPEAPGFGEGAVVKLMAEEDIDVPLWEVGVGLVFGSADEFVEYGAPPDLAGDLAAWAADRQRHGRGDRSDLVALELLERLRRHFEYRYEFVYRP